MNAQPLDTNLTEPFGRSSIVFAGRINPVARHSLRLLQTEYPDAHFHHVSDASGLADLSSAGGTLALALIDESLADALIDAPADFAGAAGSAQLALAYRAPETAMRLVAASRSDPVLSRVGFLPFSIVDEAWISLVRLLLCGEVMYPHAIVEALLKQGPAPRTARQPDTRLSPREWEVLELIAQGHTNKGIALEKDVTEHTVKLHVHNILRKLGVANRTAAARWYARHGASS